MTVNMKILPVQTVKITLNVLYQPIQLEVNHYRWREFIDDGVRSSRHALFSQMKPELEGSEESQIFNKD